MFQVFQVFIASAAFLLMALILAGLMGGLLHLMHVFVYPRMKYAKWFGFFAWHVARKNSPLAEALDKIDEITKERDKIKEELVRHKAKEMAEDLDMIYNMIENDELNPR